jgi:RNA polymerase sigma factor (TIGR02999 family)
MAEFRRGNREAAGKLVELFYPELRRMAAARMRAESASHTWQPTVLVNELYLEMTRMKARDNEGSEQERNEFFGMAAFLMRRLLLHHARPLHKRTPRVPFSETPEPSDCGEQSLWEVEDVLNRLGAIDPKLRAVVEMKVFEGLSREEIAQRLACSVRTVARHWDFAQQWLRSAIAPRVS